MTVFAFYGLGGFARETLRGFQESFLSDSSKNDEIVFIDDSADLIGAVVHDIPVLSFSEAMSISDLRVNITMADPRSRRSAYEK